jgi:hypothetical protein
MTISCRRWTQLQKAICRNVSSGCTDPMPAATSAAVEVSGYYGTVTKQFTSHYTSEGGALWRALTACLPTGLELDT